MSEREHLADSVIAALNLLMSWGHDEDCRHDDGEAKCYCGRTEMLTHLRAISQGVATEPDRIRAAVVKALRDLSRSGSPVRPADPRARADAIENGAEW